MFLGGEQRLAESPARWSANRPLEFSERARSNRGEGRELESFFSFTLFFGENSGFTRASFHGTHRNSLRSNRLNSGAVQLESRRLQSRSPRETFKTQATIKSDRIR